MEIIFLQNFNLSKINKENVKNLKLRQNYL